MRILAVAVFLVASARAARADEPCAFNGALGRDPPQAVACDAAEIEMERACHCRPDDDEAHPWGSTAGLALEMPGSARVVSGETVTLPFALAYKGEKPLTLDFPGGAVVYEKEVRRGGKEVPSAPCGELRARPRTVRLTLRPGSKVRGTMTWRASTSQLLSCGDLAHDLTAGRYTVRFATVSGEPALEASVEITVARKR